MMKISIINRILLLLLSGIFLVFPSASKGQALLQVLETTKNPNFEDMKKASEDIWKDVPVEKRRGWKQFKRWEYFWETRLNPDGTFPASKSLSDLNGFLKEDKKSRSSMLATAPSWKLIGPQSNPSELSGQTFGGIGRINIVRAQPNKNGVIWIGAAGGGVWRSNDQGKTWKTFPFTQFLSLGVSDIAFAASRPGTVYVATGDADGIGGGGGNSYSIGIIKSTDDGNTWSITNLQYYLSSNKLVTRIIVDSQNPDIVIAATSDGIYKSNDGGNSWSLKTGNAYFKDMEVNPSKPEVLYASTFSWSGSCSIFKSTDKGESWKSVSSYSNVVRIALAVTSANPSKVYALNASTNAAFSSFNISTDEGETWQTIYNNSTGVNILGRDLGTGNDRYVGQGWYDLGLGVSIDDDKTIIAGGINIWRSTDGGSSWSMIAHWTGGYGAPYVHADQHDIYFDENSGLLYSTNDGGIDQSADLGTKWTNINRNMSLTQFYKISCSATDSTIIYGGAQDNGSMRLNKGNWARVYGGDGMQCQVDWNDPNNSYVSLYNGNIYRSTNGGNNFYNMISANTTSESGAWVTPFIISPVKSSTLYAGFQNVWKSFDYGRHWVRLATFGNSTTLRHLAAAPSDSNTVYASNLVALWVTTNGGINWSRITDTPDNITGITVDPKDARHFWLTNGGYNNNSKVFEYHGSVKTNVSGNLPNVPVNCLVYQKDSPDRLYIGTDIGVFYSDYNSGYWEPYGTDLPNMIVSDLDIHYASGKLRAATYGRGVWEIPLNKCNIAQPKVAVTGNTNLCTGDSAFIEAVGDYSNFYWSTGEKTRKIAVTQSGTYSLIVEDESGCKAHSTAINITIKPVSSISIKTIGKFPVCIDDTMNLELNVPLGFVRYSWSTGDTARRIKISTPGLYTIAATTKDSCVARDTIEVKIYPKPQKPTVTRWTYNTLLSSPASGYQWYLDGKMISGATQQVLKIPALGNYSVKITDDNGCTNISDSMLVISDVNDNQNVGEIISCFPNPNDGQFNLFIQSPVPSEYSVEVRNMLGIRIVGFSANITDSYNRQIDLTGYPAGVYDVIVKSAYNTWIQKIVVK